MCQSLLGKNSWESTTFHGVQHWMSSLQLDATNHTHPNLIIIFENPTKIQFMLKLIHKIFNYKKDHFCNFVTIDFKCGLDAEQSTK